MPIRRRRRLEMDDTRDRKCCLLGGQETRSRVEDTRVGDGRNDSPRDPVSLRDSPARPDRCSGSSRSRTEMRATWWLVYPPGPERDVPMPGTRSWRQPALMANPPEDLRSVPPRGGLVPSRAHPAFPAGPDSGPRQERTSSRSRTPRHPVFEILAAAITEIRWHHSARTNSTVGQSRRLDQGERWI